MVEQAIEFWRNQWGLESESVRQLGMPFITDAHRSAMRNLPRPRKGCHTVESEERGRGVDVTMLAYQYYCEKSVETGNM
jgi:hypothetical protein